jgi:hypothetical protein
MLPPANGVIGLRQVDGMAGASDEREEQSLGYKFIIRIQLRGQQASH